MQGGYTKCESKKKVASKSTATSSQSITAFFKKAVITNAGPNLKVKQKRNKFNIKENKIMGKPKENKIVEKPKENKIMGKPKENKIVEKLKDNKIVEKPKKNKILEMLEVTPPPKKRAHRTCAPGLCLQQAS